MADTNQFRTHSCGELRLSHVNTKVTLAGFVDGSKMEGKAIDLRDRTGATGCLMPEKPGRTLDDLWLQVTPESVVQITGKVMKRKKEDPSLATGDVLVMIESITILSPSEVLPRELERHNMGEEDRFRYRILYLRRLGMQSRLELRSRFLLEARKHLAGKNFVEVETPLLGRPDAEAAASFLIPVADGKGYALPASAQAFKQAAIAGGVEKLFQIARCFRNETTTTPVRQPEFSVLDLELAWADEEQVLAETEELLAAVLETVGAKVKLPLERIPYDKALQRFGTATPDLRARFEIADATGTAKSQGVKEAAEALGKDGAARFIRVEGGVERLGDAELDLLVANVNRRGKAKAAWIKSGEKTGLRGPGVRYFGTGVNDAMTAFKAKGGDAVLLTLAGEEADAHQAAGEVRTELVRMIGDKDSRAFACAFITRLPFFAFDEKSKEWVPKRHPFTQPRDEDLGILDDEKRKTAALSKAFTLVINGVEIGSGSVRNHDAQLQEKIFKLLGVPAGEIQKRYGAAQENFRYGIPPHAGITLQLDRLLAMAAGEDAIDEVMAFPKARVGGDLMHETPMPLDSQHVRSLLG